MHYKIKLKLLVLIGSIVFIRSVCHATTSCFCEIGSTPENQKIFFAIGCKIWLDRQFECHESQIVPENTNYQTANIEPETTKLSIGYVGHWANSYDFISYLQNSILPVMHRRDYSVYVDNTACNAMKDPESVSQFLNMQKFSPNQVLVARGNQAISIGTWDIILPSTDNFIAEVSSQINHVLYPNCSAYENKPCFDSYQKNESAYCLDSAEVQTKLFCCESRSEKNAFQWLRRANCWDSTP